MPWGVVVVSLVGRAISLISTEGPRSVAWRTAKWATNRFSPFAQPPLSSVYREDVLAVDWTHPRRFASGLTLSAGRGYRVAWLITPPSETSGGHQNAFRFMSFLEAAGHSVTVFLYSAGRYPVVSVDQVRKILRGSGYPQVSADIRVYDPVAGLDGEFDAVVASDWQASYAAYRYPGKAKRFYFVQDYEPNFYAAGSDYVLAENSYRLGFRGLTAGRWLADKLESEYGMKCDPFDFAADTSLYRRVETGRRSEVVFYVRPPTPRRGTEFGLLALAELNRLRPDITINLVGWDMSSQDVPFDHVNHKTLGLEQLAALYSRCAAGLVFSLTNMSLLPIELMAAGVVPVVNDGPNTRGVFDSPYIEYVPLSPLAVARTIIGIVDRIDSVEHSRTIAASVASMTWADPAETFVANFNRAMSECD